MSQAQQEAPSVVYATGMLGGALIVVCIGIVLYLYGPGWLRGLRCVWRKQMQRHTEWEMDREWAARRAESERRAAADSSPAGRGTWAG